MKLFLARRKLEAIERRNARQQESDAALAAKIGSEIRRERLANRKKLRHLAKATGLSLTRVFEIEMGVPPLLSPRTLDRIIVELNGGSQS